MFRTRDNFGFEKSRGWFPRRFACSLIAALVEFHEILIGAATDTAQQQTSRSQRYRERRERPIPLPHFRRRNANGSLKLYQLYFSVIFHEISSKSDLAIRKGDFISGQPSQFSNKLRNVDDSASTKRFDFHKVPVAEASYTSGEMS